MGEAYTTIPGAARVDVNGERWLELEAAIDTACARGDERAAARAIERWERYARSALTGGGRQ